MKRIIDGVAYNTETATKIASAEWDNSERGGPRSIGILYQTRGGAFFLHDQDLISYKNRDDEWQERESNSFAVMTREEAHAWVMKNDVELLSDVFGEPPEASADDPLGATIYARVPASLKSRVEAAAKQGGLSVNSYLIRCMEICTASLKAPDAPPTNQLMGNALGASADGAYRNPLAGRVSDAAPPATPRNALFLHGR